MIPANVCRRFRHLERAFVSVEATRTSAVSEIRGWSTERQQGEVASVLGISQSHLSEILSGRRSISRKLTARVLDLCPSRQRTAKANERIKPQ